MAKKRKVVLRFEDIHGDRMDLLLVEKSTGYRVFARHTRRKVVSEGASSEHQHEKYAEKALEELAASVREKGWAPRLPKKHEDDPVPMKFAENGDRLFLDRRTGEYIRDESASRPPQVRMPDTTVLKRKKEKVEPVLDDLLKN